MELDPWHPRPLYLQLADTLREEITSGRIGPGQPLPSENALRQETGLAKATVRAALAVLRDEGAIVTLRGRGSYVPPEGDHKKA